MYEGWFRPTSDGGYQSSVVWMTGGGYGQPNNSVERAQGLSNVECRMSVCIYLVVRSVAAADGVVTCKGTVRVDCGRTGWRPGGAEGQPGPGLKSTVQN
jgi:hypothetical protein